MLGELKEKRKFARIGFILTLILLLFILATCSKNDLITDTEIKAQVKISVSYPAIYTQKLLKSQNHIFAFQDEIPISKYRVTLKNKLGEVIFTNDFTTNSISFTVNTYSQEHFVEVKAYTTSSIYPEETLIMKGSKQTLLVDGVNQITVNLEFENGSYKHNISLSNEIPSSCTISQSSISLTNPAKGLTYDFQHIVNSRTDNYEIGNLYPGVWHITYNATIIDNGAFLTTIQDNFVVIIYPSFTTQYGTQITNEWIPVTSQISINSVLPYIAPVENLSVSWLNGRLKITFNYNVSGATFNIYKKFKNEPVWRFVCTTLNNEITLDLTEEEYQKLERLGVNAKVGNRESGIQQVWLTQGILVPWTTYFPNQTYTNLLSTVETDGNGNFVGGVTNYIAGEIGVAEITESVPIKRVEITGNGCVPPVTLTVNGITKEVNLFHDAYPYGTQTLTYDISPSTVVKIWSSVHNDYENHGFAVQKITLYREILNYLITLTEDFEKSALSLPNVTFGGNTTPIRQYYDTSNGYVMKLGAPANNVTSYLEFTYNASNISYLLLDYKISSEAGYDFFRVYVDGNLQHSDSGIKEWQQIVLKLDPGTHTIRLEYTSDWIIVHGDGCAYVDNIKIISTTN